MNYKLTALTPMLQTLDLEATINFYTNILGFGVENYQPDWGWVSFKFNDVNIMFSMLNQHNGLSAPVMSGSLYLNADNVDVAWETLKEQCRICYPIENFEYGMREFAIFDNNGYLIQFGQTIETQ